MNWWNKLTDIWDSKAEAGYERLDRTSKLPWYIRFVASLNNVFNSHHDWLDYSQYPETEDGNGIWSSLSNKYTGAGLTGAEREANAFSAQMAQDQRDWEERMSNTAFQRQVADMQAAGVNPALAMSGSAGAGASTPSGSSASSVAPSANMSDLMSLLLLPLNAKMLKSQIRNVDANTNKTEAETEHMEIINKYLPEVTQTQIEDVLASIGVKRETASKLIAETDLVKLDQDIKSIEKVIKQAEADHSSEFYHWRNELEKSQTDEAKKHAAEMAVKAAMDTIEKEFMEKNGAKMGSSGLIAIAACLANAFGTDFDSIADFLKTSPFVGLFKSYRGMFYHYTEPPAGSDEGAGGR